MVPKQVTTYYAQSDIDIIRMYKKIGFVNNIGKHMSDYAQKWMPTQKGTLYKEVSVK